MMKRVSAYFRVQVKSYLGNRSGIFVSLIFPVMMIFIFGSIMPPDYLRTILPGLIGFSILTDSLFSVTGMTAKYRLMNLFSQLSLTPLKRSEFLIAVFIWHLIIAAVSFFLIILIGHFAFSAVISLNILVLPYIVGATLLFVSMGLLIGVVAKTNESASVISNAVGFPMMVLTGTFFPITLLPHYLQVAVKVLPLYYFVQGMGNIMATSNTSEALLYLGILAGLSIAFFIAAIRLFRWRNA